MEKQENFCELNIEELLDDNINLLDKLIIENKIIYNLKIPLTKKIFNLTDERYQNCKQIAITINKNYTVKFKTHYIYYIRGIHMSGKSFFIKKLVENNYRDYRLLVIDNMNYWNFRHNNLTVINHLESFDEFYNYLSNIDFKRYDFVIIDYLNLYLDSSFHKIDKKSNLKISDLFSSILKYAGIIFTETVSCYHVKIRKNDKRLLSGFKFRYILNFYYENLNHDINSIMNREYYVQIIDKNNSFLKNVEEFKLNKESYK